VNDGARTHNAGFQGANQRHPRQTIVAGVPARFPQCHDFGVTRRVVRGDRMIVTASNDCAIGRDNQGANRNLSAGQRDSRLFQSLSHQFIVHDRMLNYRAMKSLRGLVFAILLLPAPGWAQGVRMSADFFPLEVGKRWIYDLTNESGQRVGQLEFEVEDYSIVAGSSFYVLSEFPFSPETGAPVRFIRYDRGERYFVRKSGDNEGPLFLDDDATTEVVESDSSGAPLKFILRTGKMALTFQRSVGIVEARMDRSGVPVTAKLVTAPSTASRPAPTATSTEKSTVMIPPPATPNRRESPVASVTPQNPRVEIVANAAPGGGYRIGIALTNTSDKLLPLRFTSSQTYDFVIYDTLSDREVWRWSKGHFFNQVVRNESIRPESKWQFEVVWDRKDNNDTAVPSGAYRLTAIVTSSPLIQTSIPLNLP
jgi:hypothetical protein